jgi:cytochrome c-type biogenesis protein CcmH/NrfG
MMSDDISRLDRIEAQLEKLATALSSTQGTVATVQAGLTGLENSFKSVTLAIDRLSQRGMANWPVYLSAIAVIIIIGTLALTPTYTHSRSNGERIDKFFEMELQQAFERGTLQAQISKLENGNPNHEARINGLEREVFSSKIEHSFKKSGGGVIR